MIYNQWIFVDPEFIPLYEDLHSSYRDWGIYLHYPNSIALHGVSVLSPDRRCAWSFSFPYVPADFDPALTVVCDIYIDRAKLFIDEKILQNNYIISNPQVLQDMNWFFDQLRSISSFFKFP